MGDVIDVGGSVGEVSRIGIRASVIRTADGSEIIVPNGSLISSQVTNWTLSDRKRAVEVSVNVAAENCDRIMSVSVSLRELSLTSANPLTAVLASFSANAC